MSELNDIVSALTPVVAAFNLLRIQYYVGGSVASSYHGAVRSTMDVDVVCEMREEHIDVFLQQFGEDFYVSEVAVRQAVRQRSCFNLIHYASSLKVDVFVSRQRPFDCQCMRRAEVVTFGDDNNPFLVSMASVEDIIISKLEWFRLTEETSERQWADVTRLIRLLGDKADLDQLRHSADLVGVSDLLKRLVGN